MHFQSCVIRMFQIFFMHGRIGGNLLKKKFLKLKIAIPAALCALVIFAQSAWAGNADPIELKDGIYTVNIALWHQFMDKPSMGNKGIIPEAEVEVKDGKATMFMETRIIEVTGITASLVSFYNFDEEKQDFSKAEARAYNFEIDGQKRPRIFIFPINPGKEFYRCMVDPKVEVMGDKPIEARIKVDWSSIKPIEKSLKQEIIEKNADSDILAKVELQKQADAGVSANDTQGKKHELLPVVSTDTEVRAEGFRPGPLLTAMPVTDVIAPGGTLDGAEIVPVEFDTAGEIGEASKNPESGKDLETRESKGIILGILFFILALIAASIAVIAVFMRKISGEMKRSSYLDAFEGELKI